MPLVISAATSGSTTIQATDAVTAVITLPSATDTLVGKITPSFTTTIGVGAATPSASGAGITFPATQSASTDANTLDDYEEGTWTPSVGGTATYAQQRGTYTKIGNVVTYFCILQIVSIGTGSTTGISGLPFSGPDRGRGGSMTYWAALSQAVVYLSPVTAGTDIGFEGAPGATPNVTDWIAIFANSSYVIFGGTYATS
jgi:hypothetical protein